MGPPGRPAPSGSAITQLLGDSCATDASCIAVGNWSTSYNGLPSSTLAEGWDGTAWTIQPTPDPAGATDSSLNGVACTSASACVAVGSSNAGGVLQTLVETHSG